MMEKHQNASGRYALLSVTDKTGLAPFAEGLVGLGYTLLSTGGTAKLLRDHGLKVMDVAEYTGSPEILDGRVKTLHPKVHGGVLYDRANADHRRTVDKAGIGAIDVIVVNLYQFREKALAKGLDAAAAIEHIDIGGPTMLRAAAKNWQHCLAVIDPADYEGVLAGLKSGGLAAAKRQELAAKVFRTVSAYDAMIASFLDAEPDSNAPERMTLALERVQGLRYGENPHQSAALYAPVGGATGFARLDLKQGKELSYNNILDLDAAIALATEIALPAVAIIKHTNPCGVAAGADPTAKVAALYERALSCDPKSAFGGIVAANRPIDAAAASAIAAVFTECVAAPAYSAEALAIFAQKPALRVMTIPARVADAWTFRSVHGALLAQRPDAALRAPGEWQVVTKRTPDAAQQADLAFAAAVAKHVKSNAIVFAHSGLTTGIGAGQMSRIDAAQIAVDKAAGEGRTIAGSVMASDAFFPFRDTVEFAAKHGVTAIVQPGGSKKDQDSIDAADQAGIAMVFTGERHFRH